MAKIWTIFALFLMLNAAFGEDELIEDLTEQESEIRDDRAPKEKKSKVICKTGKYGNKSVSVGYSQKDGDCIFDFIGDRGCDIELTCDIDMPGKPPDCDDASLKISDGVGGFGVYCGKQTVTVQPHSPDLRDLFVDASEAGGKKWSCKSACASGAKNRLPKALEKKEEFRCVCGLQNKDDRIVGGEDAKMNEFPWQAAVVFPGTRAPLCGASMINDKFILTAAHCFVFEKLVAKDIEVLMHAFILDMTEQENAKDVPLGQEGSTRGKGYKTKSVTDAQEKSKRYKVAEIVNHPLFNDNYDYDYALLRIESKIDLVAADSPTPICLPEPKPKFMEQTFEGTKPYVVGWGKSHEKAGASTKVLQKLEVPVIPLKKCDSWVDKVTQRMICAGYEEGGKDACTGDSGGPLIWKQENKQWQQIGIVSWGSGCARKKSPGFYSRVTENLPWILQHASTHGAKWCRIAKD